MDDGELLRLLSTGHPVGVGGCQSGGSDACGYDVTIFDGSNKPDEVVFANDASVRIGHGSLDDLDSDTLVSYDSMRILQDPSWELQMLLSRVRDRRTAIFRDYARDCLINSIFCVTRAGDGLGSDVFAPCWAKSSLIYLANSLLALNLQGPTPAHCLDRLRNLAPSPVSDRASIVNDCIGVERATTSLLERMCKSTVGFSDKVKHSHHSRIIREKTRYFIKNSMLADCYMYLSCINHANFVSLKDSIHKRPDLIYILRVAFDLEGDREKLRRDLGAVRSTCDSILQSL